MGGNACNGWRFWSLAATQPTQPGEPTDNGEVTPTTDEPGVTKHRPGRPKKTVEPELSVAEADTPDEPVVDAEAIGTPAEEAQR